MQASHRTYFELVLLIGLCVAIALTARDGGIHAVLASAVFPALLVVMAVVFVYGGWRLLRTHVKDVSLLTGALWELVRLMEIRPRNGPSVRAGDRKDLLHHFAVEGAHKVGAGRAMPMGEPTALDLTRLAFELMDRNDRDGAGHGNRVNSLRRGLFVFYAIAKLEKPEIAFMAMCEHMKTQLLLGEESGIENFTEMKLLLGLPARWPTQAEDITALARQGISDARRYAILQAVRFGRGRMFDGLHYTPPGQPNGGYDAPDDILRQMREYIR